jgi:phage gpG-like protein
MAKFNITATFENTVDMQKIHDKVQRMKTNILVGYPSGRPHVEAIHEVNDEERRTSSGTETENGTQIDTSELAKDLYYGTAKIPARPFLTDAIEENKEEIAESLKKEVQREFNGGQANWGRVGSLVVGKIQALVRSDYYKDSIPNSPQTIRNKGSDKPLIDSGDLINSTAFIVQGGD